jgi:16S rRNA (cytosine967-C5)-methyltransferase
VRLTSLYGHVVELLTTIVSGRRAADDVSNEFYRARRYLGARDRRFIADCTYAVLRNSIRLHYTVREALKTLGRTADEIPPVMLVAAGAFGDPAVWGENWMQALEELWPVSGPPPIGLFLEALAGVAIPEGQSETVEWTLSVRHSIPEFVVSDWARRWGLDETERLCRASNLSAPVTLRVNSLRCTPSQCLAALAREGVVVSRGSLAPDALTLAGRTPIQTTLPFREGWCEVQDEGSQWVSRTAGVRPGMVVIDACAGAGGKSLHLAALMENRGAIFAVDPGRKKLQELERRSRRAGATIIRPVWSADGLPPGRFEAGGVDLVLVDAPCSGTGTFRRSPWLKLSCTPERVAQLVDLQLRLLEHWSPLVRPGGRLVYSTCSLLSAENEGVVDAFLSTHRGFLPVGQGVGTTPGGSQWSHLFPHRTGTDGFFVAILERRDGTQ